MMEKMETRSLRLSHLLSQLSILFGLGAVLLIVSEKMAGSAGIALVVLATLAPVCAISSLGYAHQARKNGERVKDGVWAVPIAVLVILAVLTILILVAGSAVRGNPF